MSAPRFFLAPEDATLAPSVDLVLPAAVARHAVQVLRLRHAAPVVLFDGRGGEYEATLAVNGREVRALVQRHVDVEREQDGAPSLVQAIVAHDTMDAIVRKAVELGAARVEPVIAQRTQRVADERAGRRLVRWRQIAVAACEQCGRNRIPAIMPPMPLDEWIAARGDCSDAILLDPGADAVLRTAVSARVPAAIVVGPEGGLTDAEAAALATAGARAVRIAAAVLRADTAAIAALAALNALTQRTRPATA